MGNIIQDLAEGGAKGLFSGVGNLVKDIRTAITGIDPEKQAEIEEKLLEFESKSIEAQNALRQIEEKDRESARVREVELAKAGKKDLLPKILAILAVVSFVGCLYALFKGGTPEGSAKDVLLMLIGALIAIVKDIYGYFFGSSSGSSDKTQALADALKSMVKK